MSWYIWYSTETDFCWAGPRSSTGCRWETRCLWVAHKHGSEVFDRRRYGRTAHASGCWERQSYHSIWYQRVGLEARESNNLIFRVPFYTHLFHQAFRALQTAYIQLLQNPFYTPDEYTPAAKMASAGINSADIAGQRFVAEVKRIGELWAPGLAKIWICFMPSDRRKDQKLFWTEQKGNGSSFWTFLTDVRVINNIFRTDSLELVVSPVIIVLLRSN